MKKKTTKLTPDLTLTIQASVRQTPDGGWAIDTADIQPVLNQLCTLREIVRAHGVYRLEKAIKFCIDGFTVTGIRRRSRNHKGVVPNPMPLTQFAATIQKAYVDTLAAIPGPLATDALNAVAESTATELGTDPARVRQAFRGMHRHGAPTLVDTRHQVISPGLLRASSPSHAPEPSMVEIASVCDLARIETDQGARLTDTATAKELHTGDHVVVTRHEKRGHRVWAKSLLQVTR